MLHSTKKKHNVSSVRSLEDDAFAKTIWFKDSSDDTIPSDSGSSKDELGCFCHKYSIPFHPQMYDVKYVTVLHDATVLLGIKIYVWHSTDLFRFHNFCVRVQK
jgi:hypothetical protein